MNLALTSPDVMSLHPATVAGSSGSSGMPWPVGGGWLHDAMDGDVTDTDTAAVVSPAVAHVIDELCAAGRLPQSNWPLPQRQVYLDQLGVQISRHLGALADEFSESAIQAWIARTGDHPDYLTKVALVNNATAEATTIALRRLDETIDAADEDSGLEVEPPRPDRSEVPWDQRWTRTYYRTDPTEELEVLAADLWPACSTVFRIKMGYLLAARAEDGLALPADHSEPLATELADMVYQDLRDDGLRVE